MVVRSGMAVFSITTIRLVMNGTKIIRDTENVIAVVAV